MRLISSLKSLVLKAGERVEGGRINGPLAPVSHPVQGWIPMSWPWNFWQLGHDVLTYGDNAVVEACVWAYIRAIAQLPGFHRRDQDDGSTEDVTTSALSRLLRNPNWYMTASDFLTHLIRSLLLSGNSYWLAERNERNEVTQLHWTNSRACHVNVVTIKGVGREVFYTIGDNPLIDISDPSQLVVPARDVLHIKLETPRHPLIGETWLSSLAVILANRGAATFASSSFFNNAGRPSGVITVPPEIQMTEAQATELRQRWLDQTTGTNAGGTPVLTRGIKWEQTAISGEDSQIVEQLRLNDQLICSVFGVPPMLIGLSSGGTAVKTAEQEMQSWLVSGLGWLINHIEVAIDKFIDLPGWQAGEYTELDTRALLRSQFRERIEGLARGVQAGIFAPNEARAIEGYGAAEAGDEPRVQQQMVPLSFALEPPAPPAPPAPPPAEPAGEPAAEGEVPDDEARMIVLASTAKALQDYEAFRAHR